MITFIAILKDDLLNHPNNSLILAARYLVTEYEGVPDWVHCLARGNTEYWEEVILATLSFLTADEMEMETNK